MSRYRFWSDDQRVFYVGWDNPFQAYFFQSIVLDEDENEEFCVNCPDLDQLKEKLKHHGLELGPFEGRLLRDRSQATKPTEHQRRVMKLFDPLGVRLSQG